MTRMNRTQQPHFHVVASSHAGAAGKNNEDRYAVSSYATEGDRPVLFAVPVHSPSR